MASMEISAVLTNQHAISEKGYRVTEPLDQMRGKTDAKTLTQVLNPAYTLETVDAGGVSAVWVTPPDVTSDFVYLFYHGGAYVKGNVAASHKAVFALCKTLGARCLTVDYRVAPENPYPAAVDDARMAWRYLLNTGHKSERVILSGGSAGGGLALALAVH